MPIFAELSDASIASILGKMSEFEAPAGQVLIQPSREGSGMFVIEEGTVEVIRKGATLELGPGEFFGELALLSPQAIRTARVKAITPVRCMAISRADFVDLLHSEPSIAVAMLEILAQRLTEALS